MIDIESDILQLVEEAVAAKRPDVEMYDIETRAPASFPCITLREMDNYCHMSSRDTSSTEKYAQVMYELNAYSNLTKGRKKECREIFALADEALIRAGFTRMSMNPVEMQDATIYRLAGRYQAVISRDKVIYRRG